MTRSVLSQEKGKYRKLLTLALPIMLQNLISSLVGVADTVMVGLIGQNELAGLTLANTVFMVVNLLIFGIMSGEGVLMSQYWGKGDTASINRILGIGFTIACSFTALFAALVLIFPEAIMGVTSSNPALVAVAVRYARIVAPAFFLNSITMVYVSAQRSAENPKFGLFVLSASCGTNVFLNWVLIFGKLGFPAMGVEGAAIATLLSRVLEVCITFCHMLFIDKRLHLKLALILRPGKAHFKDFIKYAIPVVANETLWGLGTSVIPLIYGHMENSADVVAALSVANNVDQLANVLLFGVANAAAVIIGNEIGEGKSREETYRTGEWLLTISTLVGVSVGSIIVLMALLFGRSWFLPLFSLSENAIEIALLMLITVGISMPFNDYISTLIVGVLRGGGAVTASLRLDVLPEYLYSIPLAYLLAIVFKVDIRIIFVVIRCEILIKFIPGICVFRKGKWIRDLTRR